MYVQVVVNIPKDKTFCYSVPPTLSGEAIPGRRIAVPFGKKIVTGYVLETSASADIDKVKEIASIPDGDPYFSEPDLLFFRWISKYYLYPLGKMLFDILPTPVAPRREKQVFLERTPGVKLSGRQEQLVAFLQQYGPVLTSRLREEFKNAPYLVRCLQKKGILRVEEKKSLLLLQ